MWTNSIDKIFVINLAKRTDRMASAKSQLDKFNVPFERVEAIEMLDGADGLRRTMILLFERAIMCNYQHILVFEDDLEIICEDFNNVMEKVIEQRPFDYDMILLGGQLCSTPTKFFWDSLIHVKNAYATHAVMYSWKCMNEILRAGLGHPIDNWLVKVIQTSGNTYMTYPILVSQMPSKSDIYTSEPIMDWRKYIQTKYWIQIERMKVAGNFFVNPQKQKA